VFFELFLYVGLGEGVVDVNAIGGIAEVAAGSSVVAEVDGGDAVLGEVHDFDVVIHHVQMLEAWRNFI